MSYHLLELIDANKVEEFLNCFYYAFNKKIALIDNQHNVLSVVDGEDFCGKAVKSAVDQLQQEQFSGFSVPITINNQQIARFVVEQGFGENSPAPLQAEQKRMERFLLHLANMMKEITEQRQKK